MIRKSLSAVMAVALAVSMSFSVPEEVLAASEDTTVETDIAGDLEVEFVDNMEDLEVNLEEIQAEELPRGNGLERKAVSDIVISEENSMGDKVRSSRADGISMAYSDQSVTVEITGIIKSENSVSYIPVALAPGEILQATLKLPTNVELDYDLLLYEFDNDTLGDYIKGSTLTTYMNNYPDGTTKSVDEAIAYINTDSVVHSYAVIVFPSKGYSTTESFGLTISLDQAGYYDASEPNESPFDVKTVTSNTNIVGNNLNVINDQDWFVISTTKLRRIGFVVSESSYSVEVYYALDKSMVLVNPQDGLYNLSEGNYYIKVYNKKSEFVSKDYSLQVEEYGYIPAKINVYYDGDMNWNIVDFIDKSDYHYTGYRFYQVLLPSITVVDSQGNRVAYTNVAMKWTSGGRRDENGHYQTITKVVTTDKHGMASFRMVTPTALGVRQYTM
ncbi:MAG: hypothetical protein K2M91_14560, partial [Lachnospiraceae bacterium]|nr:hypothetical protein [Lachnospiraceae bacterium]